MRRGVVEVVEIVAEENGRNAGMFVADAIHQANLVVNVGNDQTGFVSASHATEKRIGNFSLVLRAAESAGRSRDVVP